MAFDIDAIPHLDLVIVKMSGKMSCAERAKALDGVLSLLDAHHFTKVLVDFRKATLVQEDFGVSNAYARRLASEASLRRCRIAYLTTKSQNLHDVVGDLANARNFQPRRLATLTEGLAWLLNPNVQESPDSGQ